MLANPDRVESIASYFQLLVGAGGFADIVEFDVGGALVVDLTATDVEFSGVGEAACSSWD